LTKPVLYAVAPPMVADQISIDFMNKRLALSGLVPEDIGAYPLDSNKYGFTGSFCIPYNDPSMYRTRHDREVDKYHQPKGKVDIWWPPQLTLEQIQLNDTLFIIEGELKAARFFKEWPMYGVIGIGGAWNYAENMDNGGKRLLPNLIKCLHPKKRVIAIFDGDILEKAGIQMAASSLRQLLEQHACILEIRYPPEGKGVDDWLQLPGTHALADLVHIPYDKLQETRKQRYIMLGCSMNEGKLNLNETNAGLILTNYFDGRTYIDKRLGLIHEGTRASIDLLEIKALNYMQSDVNARFSKHVVNSGVKDAIYTKRRDLVQEALRLVQWDGVERLATWGSQYFDSDWPEYTNEWGRILMTGFALRLITPGTKVDKVCILAGPQGIGKSTFFENLSEFAGHRFYYACTTINTSAGDQNRSQGIAFSESTIVDLAEGVVFETKKKDMDTVKQTITQSEDAFRLPYAKSVTVEPRGFIFVGTTNRYDQLSDATGSRRYQYLKVNKIRRLPYQIKLQILAEVIAHEAEIRNSDWWEERLNVENAPAALRMDNEHIKSVQELINVQFTKADAQVEFLTSLIESNELASLKDGSGMYVTAAYLSARGAKNLEFSDTNMWSRKLSALAASPTFPYKLELQRKRIPQLICSEAVKQLYQQSITNAQLMINGYIVTRK